MNQFMKEAIAEAVSGSSCNEGGPFGAVICQNGQIIARGHNEVIKSNDPTAHAEMVTIRRASAKLGRFDLSDCELYTSCEPCPMCLSAIYWSRIPVVYYGCNKKDAADIGFDDDKIYQFIGDPSAQSDVLRLVPLEREGCLPVFAQWRDKQDKTMY